MSVEDVTDGNVFSEVVDSDDESLEDNDKPSELPLTLSPAELSKQLEHRLFAEAEFSKECPDCENIKSFEKHQSIEEPSDVTQEETQKVQEEGQELPNFIQEEPSKVMQDKTSIIEEEVSGQPKLANGKNISLVHDRGGSFGASGVVKLLDKRTSNFSMGRMLSLGTGAQMVIGKFIE